MKLRLHRHSLRLRLTPADVDRLQRTGEIAETIPITPSTMFCYGIHLRSDIDEIRATFDANRLSVDLPAALAGDWAQSQTVSLRQLQETGAANPLEILIEKDFECLDADPAHREETFYPNPNKVCR